MILVDSTVWIDYFNGKITSHTDFLNNILSVEPILIGDIILGEVLQGFRRESDFDRALDALSKFHQVSLLTPVLAIQSVRNYRKLRELGLTVGKTIDCFIATYCIQNKHELLHTDSDFDPFEIHLGLQAIHP